MARLKQDYELELAGSEKVYDCPYRQRGKQDGCYHTIYRGYRHLIKSTYIKTIYKCQLSKPNLISYVSIKNVDRPPMRGHKQMADWAAVQ
jgi:hypothetical protein